MKPTSIMLINLLIGILLTGCLSETPTPETTLPVKDTPTQLPTGTPTLAVAQTFTPTDTSLPTTTWTPLPTIPPNEISDVLSNLTNSNTNCRLPCWWGITPGKTSLSEAQHFLSQFPFEIGKIRTQRTYYNGEYHNEATFGFRIENAGELLGTVDIYSTDEIVDVIYVQLKQFMDNYQLEKTLALLGKPVDVYISAQSSSPVLDLAPTILILDYSNQGILIEYYYATRQVGSDLEFCLPALKINLSLRNPNANTYTLPIEKSIEIITSGNSLLLKDATIFSTNSFYDTFLNPSSEKCVVTPANIWP
jgi:hypothetical protein